MKDLTHDQLRAPDVWQTVLDLPAATTSGRSSPLATNVVRDIDLPAISGQFWQQGFAKFSGHNTFPQQPLAATAQRLYDAGIPAAFIFLDPRAWQAFASLSSVLSYFLGPSPALLPHLWAWYIGPVAGQKGWPRHREYEGDSVVKLAGEPQVISLSAWLALSDVDTHNAPLYMEPLTKTNPPVAITGKAGTMAIWRQDLWHFSGDMSQNPQGPRVSLSLEFQNHAFEPLAVPLLNPAEPPPWAFRLDLIMAQICAYKDFERIDPKWREIAENWTPSDHATFSQ